MGYKCVTKERNHERHGVILGRGVVSLSSVRTCDIYMMYTRFYLLISSLIFISPEDKPLYGGKNSQNSWNFVT
jgi:hypothetical protein